MKILYMGHKGLSTASALANTTNNILYHMASCKGWLNKQVQIIGLTIYLIFHFPQGKKNSLWGLSIYLHSS